MQNRKNQMNRLFDPSLDPSLKILEKPVSEHWQGYWIWYAGQRVSHLHQKLMTRSIERFNHIGYPGSFNHPVFHCYYRKELEIKEVGTLRWHGLSGRIRVNINEKELDITTRSWNLVPGHYKVLVSIDFASTLPCFIFESSAGGSDQTWEASLDMKNWCAVEMNPQFNQPNISPLEDQEEIYLIPPSKVIQADNCDKNDALEYQINNGYVLIDFGYYELGSVTFDAIGTGELNVIVGQSIEEVLNNKIEWFEQKQMPHIGGNAIREHYQTPRQCLRYVLFKSMGQKSVSNIHFQAEVTPMTYTGAFACNNSMLVDIWHMGAATIHSCTHDFYLDAIYRDALPWAMDGVGAIQGSDLVFFDKHIAQQHILSQALPVDATVNDLGVVYLDFQLYTLLGFEYEFLSRRDKSFLSQHKESMYRTLKIYLSIQDEQGFISSKAAGNKSFFPDWSTSESLGPDLFGTPCYVQILLKHCLEFGAFVAQLSGDLEENELFTSAYQELEKAIIFHFWNEQDKGFINGYTHDGKKDHRYTMYAQVFGVLYNLVDPSDYESLFNLVFCQAKFRHEAISLSIHWELQALVKMGKMSYMQDYIEEIFGSIINFGDIRIYEDIQRNGTRKLDFYGRPFGKSLCHAILGAAPLTSMSQGILGITPILGESFQYEFNPQLGQLEWAKGKVPTPFGAIEVEVNKTEVNKTEAIISVPNNISISLKDFLTEDNQTVISHQGTYHLKRVK